tara:strand:+ start:144 stop:1139 length:996 start_codon:yes stop_codon:yes gene_type:complete
MSYDKFNKKNILVAGGTGLVGQQLTNLLINLGANVSVSSLDSEKLINSKVKNFFKLDMSILQNCKEACKSQDIVFCLLGSTGSPATNQAKPATFMNANLLTAISMLEGARLAGVKEYLYTSTYGVYSHSGEMVESNMWNNPPSEHDKFAGWAKRIGELQVEAYQKQYNWKKIYIVRPANIYGPNANFDGKNSMVIPATIKKFFNNNGKVEIWGDGSAVRDFIFSRDVAQMMIDVVDKEILDPINIGSGSGTSIKELVETISKSEFLKTKPEIFYDTSKPSGDKRRVLNTEFAESKGIKTKISLEDGIRETIEWYLNNGNTELEKYNAFENE